MSNVILRTYFTDRYAVYEGTPPISNPTDIICDFLKKKMGGLTVAEFLRKRPGEALIALVEDKLVGILEFYPEDTGGVRIQLVCATQSGLGKTLIDIMKEYVTTLPVKRLTLSPFNDELRDKYYKPMGFKEMETEDIYEMMVWTPPSGGRRSCGRRNKRS